MTQKNEKTIKGAYINLLNLTGFSFVDHSSPMPVQP